MKYTQTFNMKLTYKVVEVSASASVEESESTTISSTDQKSNTTSQTISHTVTIDVPPQKKYGYQIVVHYGQISVPYTAHMIFQSVIPNSQPVRFDTQGVFTGVNQTFSEVVVSDITSGTAMVVQRSAIQAAAAAG
jgi:hypothetical protein